MFHIESPNIVPQHRKFPFRIWKVRPDPHSDDVALELRNQADKQVSYATIRPAETELKLLMERRASDWWTGIEQIDEGVLLLHGYEEPGLPLHRGLEAISSTTGETLWQDPQAVFRGSLPQQVFLERAGRYEIRDLRSGELREEIEDWKEEAFQSRLQAYETESTQGLAFPQAVGTEDPRYFSWKDRLGIEPFGPLSILRRDDWEVVAWHEGKPGEFALALAIFRQDDLVLDGWLEEDMRGMHPDPFFLHGKRLIAIRDQVEFVQIPLPD
ncbi:MAG: DUF4905 domain-containing protein [Bacteroidota bacterium]